MSKDSKKSEPPIGKRLDKESVQAVFDKHAQAMRSFLLGVLKDESATNDALQATFVQLIEKGHTIKSKDLMSSSVKSWLFRVAFNEAMLVKRKSQTAYRHQEKVAWLFDRRIEARQVGDAAKVAIRAEEIEQVRLALEKLPPEQKLVVQKRIHEGLRFREIAEELDVPLGTVLSRMQSALKRLRGILEVK